MQEEYNKISLIAIRGKRRIWLGEISIVSLVVFAAALVVSMFLLCAGFIYLGYLFGYSSGEKAISQAAPERKAPSPTEPVKNQQNMAGPPPEASGKNITPHLDFAQAQTVALEDFETSYDARSEKLRFKFLLRNQVTNASSSGYIYLVFRPKDPSRGNYLVYPQTPLDNQGIPLNFAAGEHFAINRFKVISKTIPTKDPPSSTDIFIYSTTGKLLLKKNFIITNP